MIMGFSDIFDSPKGKGFADLRTICELHREIYDILVLELHEENPKLLKKVVPILEDCYIIGVKMNRKLCEYKLHKMGINIWENKTVRKVNRKETKKRRKERIRLEKMWKKNSNIIKKYNNENKIKE
jgi:hypothetical protein